MGVKSIHRPVIQHQNVVCFLDTGNPLGHNQLCGAGGIFWQKPPESWHPWQYPQRWWSHQNQHLWLLQQSACDTQPLLLPAGDIVAALFNQVLYPSGKRSMNSSAQASRQASAHSASVASSLPQRRLSRMVPENNTSFCKTTATDCAAPPCRSRGHLCRLHRRCPHPHRTGG